MSKTKENTLPLILWEKDSKCIIWNGQKNKKNKKNANNEKPFIVATKSKKKFYFYLDNFKTAHIENYPTEFDEKKNILNYQILNKKKLIQKLMN